MKFIKYLLLSVGLLVGLIILTVVGMFVVTSGEHSVPDTIATDPSIQHVEIDDVVFHAETFGNPENPVVVVVHGGPGGDYGYLLNLHRLSDDYFVVFYDQRGAGLSPRVDASELSLASSIEDLHRIISHYGEGQPVNLVGHSWGAMLVAGYLGEHPGLVARAVLAEPGGLDSEAVAQLKKRQADSQGIGYYQVLVPTIFETLHMEPQDADARMDYIFGRMSTDFVDSSASGYGCADEPVPVKPDVAVPPSRFGATAFTAIFGDSADLSAIGANAANYTDEVLFIASECSTSIGEAFQRTQMPIFPTAQLTVIPNAGHNMFTQNPTDSLAVILKYFEAASQ